MLTWLERKIIGRIQKRVGPNRAGPFGWFQAIADMIKSGLKPIYRTLEMKYWIDELYQFLFAGGSGITPIISLLKSALRTTSGPQHALRTLTTG